METANGNAAAGADVQAAAAVGLIDAGAARNAPRGTIEVKLRRPLGEGENAIHVLTFRAPNIEDEMDETTPPALIMPPEKFDALVAEAAKAIAASDGDDANAGKARKNKSKDKVVRSGSIPNVAVMRNALPMRDCYSWAKRLYIGDPADLENLSGNEVATIGVELSVNFFMG